MFGSLIYVAGAQKRAISLSSILEESMFIFLRGGIKRNYGGRKMKETCCDLMSCSRSRFKLDLRGGWGCSGYKIS